MPFNKLYNVFEKKAILCIIYTKGIIKHAENIKFIYSKYPKHANLG